MKKNTHPKTTSTRIILKNGSSFTVKGLLFKKLLKVEIDFLKNKNLIEKKK